MEQNAQHSQEEKIMEQNAQPSKASSSRRSFLRKGLAVGGAGAIGTGLLTNGLSLPAFAEAGSDSLSKGDVAILRFLAAVEIIETDLWQQYNELGGIQDHEVVDGEVVSGGSGSDVYTDALENLDMDMPQYIHDNTEDEISHFTFLNEFLESRGAEPVNLDRFRTLQGSQATGAQKNKKRLTNLMQLTVDTSWWTRYRSRTENPDFGDTFDQAVPSLHVGQHPAIPRNDDDLTPANHIQAIANTAAFHFGFIEQGGTSLYPTLAQGVTNLEVLRILLSIGPTETMHFQVWHDKAGAAVSPPFNVTDNVRDNDLKFPDLSTSGQDLRANLIMPEPTIFLSRKFPVVSIIRPTQIAGSGGAMATIKAFTDDGLFIGQSKEFFAFVHDLAEQADQARRGS
jgi:Ferritin-like domain